MATERSLEEMEFAEWWEKEFGTPTNQIQEMVRSTALHAWLAGAKTFSELWKIAQGVAKNQVRVNGELRKENNALKDAALPPMQGEMPPRPKASIIPAHGSGFIAIYPDETACGHFDKLESSLRAAYVEIERLKEYHEAYRTGILEELQALKDRSDASHASGKQEGRKECLDAVVKLRLPNHFERMRPDNWTADDDYHHACILNLVEQAVVALPKVGE